MAMAFAAWGTVLTGTWLVVYPWYRRTRPRPVPSRCCWPNPATADWHEFGMEWKEHIAWISPILATVAAFIVVYYGTNLIRHDRVRKTAMVVLTAPRSASPRSPACSAR